MEIRPEVYCEMEKILGSAVLKKMIDKGPDSDDIYVINYLVMKNDVL